jgi:hypothetical protein
MATRTLNADVRTLTKGGAVVWIALVLAACGTPQKTLLVNTAPQGALIVDETSGHQTLSPATLYYDAAALDRHRDAYGCSQVAPLSVHWRSGVMSSTGGPVRLCGSGSSWQITVQRPSGPGLDTDIAAEAARLQELRLLALEQQIRNQQGQAALAEGFQSLGYGIGCTAGGGCGQNSPPPIFVQPPTSRAMTPPSPGREVPPWARKQDPLDNGLVCDVDSWGRQYCGPKQ